MLQEPPSLQPEPPPSPQPPLPRERPDPSLLCNAAGDSDATQVRRLLDDHNAAADVADADGEPPLVLASAFGHDACVRLLLEHGANVRAQQPRWHGVLQNHAETTDLNSAARHVLFVYLSCGAHVHI